MGIPHWEVKREIFRIVFREARAVDVIDKVIDTEEIEVNDFSKLREHYMHRWHLDSFSDVKNNSKYRPFFSDLSAAANLNESVPGEVIIKGELVQLIQALPENDLATLQKAAEDGVTVEKNILEDLKKALSQVQVLTRTDESSTDTEAFFPIWIAKTANSLRIVKDGLESGYIDQSLYYLSTESVHLWFAITNNDFYSGFDQCKTGLMRLVREPEWKDFISSEIFEGVVMLGGGGSPSKDAILVNSLIKASQDGPRKETRSRYVLLDTSLYMLTSSRRELEGGLRRMGAEDAVSIIPVESDLMNLADAMPLIRPEEGNVAWFLTGGTLGNLDENQFFESVASQAQPNDLLIVGTGCFDGEPDEQYLSNLKREYEQDEIRKLVKVPLAAAWSALDMSGTALEALDNIKIDILKGGENELSDVKDSVTVVANLSINGIGDVLLFKSSRYREEALVELAGRHRWAHVKSVDGLDSSFRQVIFRFKK